MTGQIVEITKAGYSLKKVRGFLQVSAKDCSSNCRIPLDDILTVIVSVPGCSISTNLIDHLCHKNIPVVLCGSNYLPSSFILPVEGYSRQFQVMQSQFDISVPRKKRAWQLLVKSKILNQAEVLAQINRKNRQLERLMKKVRSGDTANCEAQAARIYWQELFGKQFRRNKNAAGLNSGLNYAYAIVRSCVARGVISAGLHPTFSVHHRNPRNTLNLVDDLMEPMRPIADYLVWQIGSEDKFNNLTPEIKSMLASITAINTPLVLKSEFIENSPLSLASLKMARSFASYCMGNENLFLTPRLPTQFDYKIP